MKRKKAAFFISVVVLGLCILGYIFFAPFVLYIEPDVPSLLARRLTKPSSCLSYIVGKEGGILSRFRSPSLVVASPLGGGDAYDAPRLTWGKIGEEFCIPYSKADMYSFFISENGERAIGILFDSDDGDEMKVFESLSSSFPSLVGVPYSGRVSVVNSEEIVSSLDALWGVIVLDAEKTREAWTKTKAKVIMDNLSASSSVSLERVVSIDYDWKRIITTFFRDNRAEAYYTFTVLENPDKV